MGKRRRKKKNIRPREHVKKPINKVREEKKKKEVISKKDLVEVRDYWKKLTSEDRIGSLNIKVSELFKKIKEKQKGMCSCQNCAKKKVLIEQEIERLFAQFCDELRLRGKTKQEVKDEVPVIDTSSVPPLEPTQPLNQPVDAHVLLRSRDEEDDIFEDTIVTEEEKLSHRFGKSLIITNRDPRVNRKFDEDVLTVSSDWVESNADACIDIFVNFEQQAANSTPDFEMLLGSGPRKKKGSHCVADKGSSRGNKENINHDDHHGGDGEKNSNPQKKGGNNNQRRRNKNGGTSQRKVRLDAQNQKKRRIHLGDNKDGYRSDEESDSESGMSSDSEEEYHKDAAEGIRTHDYALQEKKWRESVKHFRIYAAKMLFEKIVITQKEKMALELQKQLIESERKKKLRQAEKNKKKKKKKKGKKGKKKKVSELGEPQSTPDGNNESELDKKSPDNGLDEFSEFGLNMEHALEFAKKRVLQRGSDRPFGWGKSVNPPQTTSTTNSSSSGSKNIAATTKQPPTSQKTSSTTKNNSKNSNNQSISVEKNVTSNNNNSKTPPSVMTEKQQQRRSSKKKKSERTSKKSKKKQQSVRNNNDDNDISSDGQNMFDSSNPPRILKKGEKKKIKNKNDVFSKSSSASKSSTKGKSRGNKKKNSSETSSNVDSSAIPQSGNYLTEQYYQHPMNDPENSHIGRNNHYNNEEPIERFHQPQQYMYTGGNLFSSSNGEVGGYPKPRMHNPYGQSPQPQPIYGGPQIYGYPPPPQIPPLSRPPYIDPSQIPSGHGPAGLGTGHPHQAQKHRHCRDHTIETEETDSTSPPSPIEPDDAVPTHAELRNKASSAKKFKTALEELNSTDNQIYVPHHRKGVGVRNNHPENIFNHRFSPYINSSSSYDEESEESEEYEMYIPNYDLSPIHAPDEKPLIQVEVISPTLKNENTILEYFSTNSTKTSINDDDDDDDENPSSSSATATTKNPSVVSYERLFRKPEEEKDPGRINIRRQQQQHVGVLGGGKPIQYQVHPLNFDFKYKRGKVDFLGFDLLTSLGISNDTLFSDDDDDDDDDIFLGRSRGHNNHNIFIVDEELQRLGEQILKDDDDDIDIEQDGVEEEKVKNGESVEYYKDYDKRIKRKRGRTKRGNGKN